MNRCCDKCGEDIPEGTECYEPRCDDPQDEITWCLDCLESEQSYYEERADYERDRQIDDKLTGDL